MPEMKRLLLLLLIGLTFLNLSACGNGESQGDLFIEEGPPPQVESKPSQTPQDKFKLFTNNLNHPSRFPSKPILDEEAEFGLSGELPAMDDADENIHPPAEAEDSPRQEDEATETPEPSQPWLNKRDSAPKSQSHRDESLDDIPPEDESDEAQDSPPVENNDEEEAPPEEEVPDQESPDNRPEHPYF